MIITRHQENQLLNKYRKLFSLELLKIYFSINMNWKYSRYAINLWVNNLKI